MLILQFLEGLVVSLLASIGVLQTPCVSVGISRHTCGVPGYYKSASFRRLPDGLALRRHLAAVLATMNGWPSDTMVAVGGSLVHMEVSLLALWGDLAMYRVTEDRWLSDGCLVDGHGSWVELVEFMGGIFAGRRENV